MPVNTNQSCVSCGGTENLAMTKSNDLVCDGCRVECDGCAEIYSVDDVDEYSMVGGNSRTLCDSCSDHLATCDDCERFGDARNMNDDYEERNICRNCIGDYNRCYHCSNLVRDRDSIFYGDYYLCPSCYEDHYFTCDQCEDVWHTDDYAQDGRCRDCVEQNESHFNGSRKPNLSFPPRAECSRVGEEYFGVEIETIFKDGSVQTKVEDDFPDWGWCYDGSLETTGDYRGTIEFLSPIMYGDRDIAAIHKFTTFLRKNGFAVNSSCGLHVHVNANGLNWEHVRNIALCWMATEDYFRSCMPRSRRNMSKCRNSVFNPTAIQLCENEYEFASRVYDINISNKSELDDYRYEKYRNCRYKTLNLHSYFHRGTLEFRLHNGTLNGEKIERWVEVCTKTVMFGKYDTDWTLKEFLGLLRKETVDYYDRRKKYFAESQK